MKISRRKFLIGTGAATLALAGLGPSILRYRQRRNRPNIILFITDDMRYDAAGFLGNTIIKTPHLDQLAGEGFVFDNNFVTTSVCPVSRASILTGQYALKHSVYDFDHNVRQDSFWRSYPPLLRQSGYHTGFIGKWGMGGYQPVHNFDEWYGFNGQGVYYPRKNLHMTDLQTWQALRFIKNAPKNKPFLLVLCYKAPHTPLEPQPRFMNLYRHDRIPRAKTDRAWPSSVVPGIVNGSLDRQDYFHMGFNNEGEYQYHMKQYYRLITGVDDSVGTIVNQLRQNKRFADTNLLFTSDNGMLEGEHGLEGKWCMYEESIRTPMLVRLAPNFYPWVKPSRPKAMTLNIDISPTIVEMAALPTPQHIQGKSLMPLMTSDTPPSVEAWRDGFYYEHPAWNRQNVIACEGYRGLQWKYVRYMRGRASDECLFNLVDDPSELNNLAWSPDYAGVLEYMRRITETQKKIILVN